MMEMPLPQNDQGLLRDLAAGELANIHARGCQVCSILGSMSESVRPAVERALAGTIGAHKLAMILTENGYPIGRRAVTAHRQEGVTS
jgi:hypothetical protein